MFFGILLAPEKTYSLATGHDPPTDATYDERMKMLWTEWGVYVGLILLEFIALIVFWRCYSWMRLYIVDLPRYQEKRRARRNAWLHASASTLTVSSVSSQTPIANK